MGQLILKRASASPSGQWSDDDVLADRAVVGRKGGDGTLTRKTRFLCSFAGARRKLTFASTKPECVARLGRIVGANS
jgi:hypothetical protein